MSAIAHPPALARQAAAAYRLLALRRLPIPTNSIHARHASTTPTPKPIKARVLEQPDKFRPPSHPQRLRKPKTYTGPPLAEHEREAQKTRKYPHMMPPEGTPMHKFLTSRTMHLWISLGVLVSLAFFTLLSGFLHETPYRDLLPPNNMFLSHPFRFLARWWEVYAMHTEYITERTMAKRAAKVDDVRKRAEYRKAHGLDEGEWFGGWGFKEEARLPSLADEASPVAVAVAGGGNAVGVSAVEGGDAVGVGAAEGPKASAAAAGAAAGEHGGVRAQRRPAKPYFGIW